MAMRFRPTILEEGDYSVQLWWPSDTVYPRDDAVMVTVSSGAGDFNLWVDQTIGHDEWYVLGTFSFDGGTDGYVQIESSGELDVITIADAVNFVYQPPHHEASISGRVFDDANLDAIPDADEEGLDEWLVELVDVASGEVVVSQLTQSFDLDADGMINPITESGLYDFVALPPGDYLVRQVPTGDGYQTLPAEPHYALSLADMPVVQLDFGIGQLFGDTNNDGLVNAADIDELFANFGSPAEDRFDLDGDGDADQGDIDTLVYDILDTEYGDTNLDGLINGTDLAAIKAGYGLSGVGWAYGDLNGNGLVDATDAAIMRANFGFERPAAPAGGLIGQDSQ